MSKRLTELMLIILVVTFIGNFVFRREEFTNTFVELANHISVWLIVITFLSLATSAYYAFYVLRKQIRELRASLERLDSAIKDPVLAILEPRFKQYLNNINGISGPDGLSFEKSELRRLQIECFNRCQGPYTGTDSNPPSEFLKKFPDYIERQVGRPGGPHQQDTRFLIVTKEDLIEDCQKHPNTFDEFCTVHINKDIRLFQVDPEIANQHVTAGTIRSTDLGVFAYKYCVFFGALQEEETLIHIEPWKGENAKDVRIFLESITSAAYEIDYHDGQLELQKLSPNKTNAQLTRMFS